MILANIKGILLDESGAGTKEVAEVLKSMSNESAFFFQRDCFSLLGNEAFRKQFTQIKSSERVLWMEDIEDIAMKKATATVQ